MTAEATQGLRTLEGLNSRQIRPLVSEYLRGLGVPGVESSNWDEILRDLVAVDVSHPSGVVSLTFTIATDGEAVGHRGGPRGTSRYRRPDMLTPAGKMMEALKDSRFMMDVPREFGRAMARTMYIALGVIEEGLNKSPDQNDLPSGSMEAEGDQGTREAIGKIL